AAPLDLRLSDVLSRFGRGGAQAWPRRAHPDALTIFSPFPSGGGQGGGLGELTHVKRPAFGVLAALASVGQPEVAKAEHGCTVFAGQRDLDRRRAGRNGRMALPTPTYDQPARRIDHLVFAAGDMFAVDIDAIPPTRPPSG